MLFHFLFAWGPIVAAALFACGIRYTLMRDVRAPSGLRAVPAILAGAVPTLVVIAPRTAALFPGSGVYIEYSQRTLLPLVLGIVSIALLMIPFPSSRTPATAQLSRRTLSTFLRPRWFIGVLIIAGAIIAITVSAGLASRPDELGRYTMYEITIGSRGATAGTEIYGWHYSTPALVALAALLITTIGAWLLVPRPAWSDDPEQDAEERRLRAANVGRVTCAALLVHLSVILQWLGGTASLVTTTTTSEIGVVSAGTSFAALGPALQWGGAFAFAVGLGMWLLVMLTGAPTRIRQSAGSAAA